jgi:hypothetical protein
MEGISMGVFVEFVANIGLAAVKDKLNDAVAEKCARDRLLSYLTQQNSLNFSVSLQVLQFQKRLRRKIIF